MAHQAEQADVPSVIDLYNTHVSEGHVKFALASKAFCEEVGTDVEKLQEAGVVIFPTERFPFFAWIHTADDNDVTTNMLVVDAKPEQSGPMHGLVRTAIMLAMTFASGSEDVERKAKDVKIPEPLGEAIDLEAERLGWKPRKGVKA